ncbi:predicted protein [Arabidopsis lyrata subsp. lyrata]|uniref:Predicted protein n=1 Tax=Arabidopsis lyrata subsp. lyrata TaxID=81972 RepID=D7LAC7_ARALL|nr:predicted protein [Arabidopsis lyrata subsp. lyrata]
MDAKGENSLALFPSKFRERKYLQVYDISSSYGTLTTRFLFLYLCLVMSIC